MRKPAFITMHPAEDNSPEGEFEEEIHIEEKILPREEPDDSGLIDELAESLDEFSDENLADEPVELESGEEETAVDETPAEELERWRDIAARSVADLENYRKRMAREKQEAIQYANRGLLEELLPVIDNFEMGLKAAKDAPEGENSIIFQGMSMVYKQIEDFLSGQGLTAIDADGKDFDPNLHEAIKQEPSDTVPEGKVIFTMRRGYHLKDRLIRAANVVVSSGEGTEEPA